MKVLWRLVTGLSVLSLMMSCAPKSANQKRGDAAYKLAQKLDGNNKRIQLKTAYMYYDKAIKENASNIPVVLRNRYVEVTLVRASMVLNEGAVHMDAIPLFLADIDKYNNQEVTPELKQQYSMLLLQMADSSAGKSRFDEALEIIDRAEQVASDPTTAKNKRKELRTKMAQENYDLAEMDYANGKANKDPEDFVKAEFWALTALYFDSTHADAKKMLATLRKENASTYSAYLKVIDPIPDSAVFKKINKYDILLAIPTMQKRGGAITVLLDMYNNSFNPLKLKADHFAFVDADGKRYVAKSARLDPEILDQEHEAKLKLIFPAVPGEIVKLEYKNGDHFTEKFLK
ncbi:MAG TPA: hypothetical protein VHO70_01035 [Chitinispirillaceae bacterium]|nr:hypothetical protein [Chitinispirillaceae bacterium]